MSIPTVPSNNARAPPCALFVRPVNPIGTITRSVIAIIVVFNKKGEPHMYPRFVV